MQDFTVTALLDMALEVAKTSAVKNKKVQRLLNTIIVSTMGEANKVGEKLASEIFEKLDELDYYDRRKKGAEPYNN